VQYSEELRDRVLHKALNSGLTQEALAQEFGIGRSTLQKWLRDNRDQGGESMEKKERRPQDWSAQERFTAVIETSAMSEEELGAWCRSQGLYSHHLSQWKTEAIAGMEGHKSFQGRSELRRLREQNKQLKKELRRKDKALAETTALLVLKKKARTIWGELEDD